MLSNLKKNQTLSKLEILRINCVQRWNCLEVQFVAFVCGDSFSFVIVLGMVWKKIILINIYYQCKIDIVINFTKV